jgi:hypothetical protein
VEKQVVAIGNSLGVIIDRGLCRVLGLSLRSRVRVSTDGRRLVLEPVGANEELPPNETIDIRAVVHHIVYVQQLPWTDIQKLRPTGAGRYQTYGDLLAWADDIDRNASELDRAYATRFMVCLRELQHGASSEDAIATSLREVPVPNV